MGDLPAVTGSDTLTYYELVNRSKKCAMILKAVGVNKGDKVALWASNDTDWVVSFFGIVLSGGIAVLMNYGQNSEDTAKLLKMTDTNDDDRTGYILDWKYSDKFDVNSFLKA